MISFFIKILRKLWEGVVVYDRGLKGKFFFWGCWCYFAVGDLRSDGGCFAVRKMLFNGLDLIKVWVCDWTCGNFYRREYVMD